MTLYGQGWASGERQSGASGSVQPQRWFAEEGPAPTWALQQCPLCSPVLGASQPLALPGSMPYGLVATPACKFK